MSPLRQRCLDPVGKQRQLADALAGGGRERVGDGGRGRTLRRLSGPERALGRAVDQTVVTLGASLMVRIG